VGCLTLYFLGVGLGLGVGAGVGFALGVGLGVGVRFVGCITAPPPPPLVLALGKTPMPLHASSPLPATNAMTSISLVLNAIPPGGTGYVQCDFKGPSPNVNPNNLLLGVDYTS